MTGEHDRDAALWRASLQEEVDSAALYRAIAELETQPQLAEVYRRLADTEESHARHWAERLAAKGEAVAPLRPSWRARTLTRIVRRFGPQLVLPTLIARERSGAEAYSRRGDPETQGLAVHERSHTRVLEAIASSPSGLEGAAVARLEGRHRAVGGNALRAAVLGVNDGLVSNLSLVMGVAGAELSSSAILVTGLAGLVAGAGSMAMGEWLSVQSSRERHGRQIEIERQELLEAPAEEETELALIYRAKGLPEADARELARRLVAEEATALETLVREELGIDPEELGGSAWEAAITSFVLFALGAVVPVAPFIFLSGGAAIAWSLALSALALFLVGAGITLITARGILFSGGRQLLIGLGAGALTYGIGRLVGASLTG